MPSMTRLLGVAAAGAALLLSPLATSSASAAGEAIPDGTQFYVPQLQHYQDALRQVARLRASGDKAGAADISAMIRTPQAVWLTGDSPAQVEREARQVTHRAAGKGELPVLVAYNIPFRDCAQYSAGGATTSRSTRPGSTRSPPASATATPSCCSSPTAWASSPGTPPSTASPEWCQPAEADPATAASDRFAMLNHAGRRPRRQRRHPGLPRRHPQRLARGRRRRRPAAPGGRRARRRLLPQRLELPAPRELAEVRRLDLAVPLVRHQPRRGRLAARPLRVLREPVLPVEPATTTRTRDRPVVPRQRHQRREPAGRARQTSPTSSSTPAATGRARGPRRPASTPTRRTGATRPVVASACARPPTPVTRWPTPSSGSRCPASPTASARAASPTTGASTPSGAASTRRPASGSRSRRSS